MEEKLNVVVDSLAEQSFKEQRRTAEEEVEKLRTE